MLDRLLGAEWRELYEIEPVHFMAHLFDDEPNPQMKRVASQRQFESWLKRRLETIFAFVSEPLPLFTSTNRQAFSLFLGVSNPSKPATDLAKRFVRYVNKNFGPEASHHKSGR
jgi:hypothetical protein